MGAARLRPRKNGPSLDGPELAELLGVPTTEVYAMSRAGVMPAPLNERWTSNPRRWRWSRKLVTAFIDGRWTPDPAFAGDSSGERVAS